MMLRLLLLALLALPAALSAADPGTLVTGLAAPEVAARLAALDALAATREPRLIPFLDDYRQGSAYTWNGRVVLVLDLRDGQGIPLDPLERSALGPAVAETALSALDVSGPERKAATAAITRLRLADPDPAVRLAAVTRAGDSGGAANRAALAALVADERDPRIMRSLSEGIALIDLADGDAADRESACAVLGDLRSQRAREPLAALAAQPGPLQKPAAEALDRIESRRTLLSAIQTLFSGISAGSILVLMALGLSITFGLMGVINMAHGEMLMIGAYATLLVQWAFAAALPPGVQHLYFLIGVPAGFCAAALVGWLLELTVIRHLYGRPLETLLATWGISYLLIQTIRSLFGDNRAVTAPAWLTGGWEPVADLVLPWNRLFIIALTAVSVCSVVILMHGTRLGLLLRATVQSRRTASSLGVDTRRIDGLTFAFGSGLAGAAGCGLTLIGGLKPDMGQEFIIDSFLVVATGGVGNLAGVCYAGFGLGILNKLLEPVTQAVFAKVLVLLGVIVFLQWKPSGLFPPKGRLADG
jgi:urea transport system permease protein